MSKIYETVLETAKDLGLDQITIREIEALDIPQLKPMKPRQIKKLRESAKMSQNVMARLLNVKPSTYQKWERGEVIPKGANLKLLAVVEKHGVESLL